MAANKSLMLYFTRHDDDLYEAIRQLPKGDRNYEIRRALRQYFLEESQPSRKQSQDGAEALDKLQVEDSLGSLIL